MSIWDNSELLADTANFVTFQNIGDKVSGVITGMGMKRWDDGKLTPQLTLRCDDGEERVLTAGQIRLKKALMDHRPEEGQHLTVTLSDVQTLPGGKNLKHFAVTVTNPKKGLKDEPLPF